MSKFNFRAAYERIDEIKGRLNEMAKNLESDNKRESFTEAEEGERKQLFRELDILEMKIKANTPTMEVTRSNTRKASEVLREALKNNQRMEFVIRRDDPAPDSGSDDSGDDTPTFGGNMSTYADGLAGTNPFGITSHDIVEPLFKKNILSAIGSPLLTGLKGNHQWPVVEAFSATINDEGVALGDTAIPLAKLIAKPERIGVAVPITREAIAETGDIVSVVATQYIPEAVAELMNDIMFSQTKVTGATNLYGPFITANMKSASKKTYTAANGISLADLVGLKGAVLKTNVKADGMCYVMNESTKGTLEATPKWEGAGAAIVDENGRINGVPVFTYNGIADGVVEFGAFKYAPQGLFGDISFIIDPYTQARKNAVDFVFNVDYAITVLRQEAFAILTPAS